MVSRIINNNILQFLSAGLIVIICCLYLGIAEGGQQYNYQNNYTILQDRLKAKISGNSANRLQFGIMPIVQIVGDENKYKVVTDSRGTNIFIIAKVPNGEIIELSLINGAGLATDLELEVADIKGQVIIINNSAVIRGDDQEQQEITAMLTSMINDCRDKYYVTVIKRQVTKLENKGLKIEQDRIYRFGNLTGARLNVTNLAKRQSRELIAAEFNSLFDGVVLTAMQQNTLLAKGKGIVWLIIKESK